MTDNRAVQLIFGSTKSKPPARIERWALRLTQFDYTIEHRPGLTNMADYYSRHPDKACPSAFMEEVKSEGYINSIARSALPKPITIGEVENSTNNDKELQELKAWLGATRSTKLPNSLSAYKHVRDELSCTTGGILLRGQRIIIPISLRSRIIDLAHMGHQGIVKTKSLVRSRVWFPGIDYQVEQKIKRCRECQANTDKQSFEPLRPTKMPKGPWQEVAGDFFGSMEDGTYWFVNYCEYSRWASVHHIKRLNLDTVVPVLKELFSVFGVPLIYKTDNGSPFQSYLFTEFSKEWGFKHLKITP